MNSYKAQSHINSNNFVITKGQNACHKKSNNVRNFDKQRILKLQAHFSMHQMIGTVQTMVL